MSLAIVTSIGECMRSEVNGVDHSMSPTFGASFHALAANTDDSRQTRIHDAIRDTQRICRFHVLRRMLQRQGKYLQTQLGLLVVSDRRPWTPGIMLPCDASNADQY